jgi:GGDEF domain-containing protein
LQHALSKAQRSGELLAILCLDFNRLKGVNDTLGHAIGDRMFEVVVQHLKDYVRQKDTVARLGGDEFILLLEGLEQPATAAKVAIKVLVCLARPFRLGGQEFVRDISADLHDTAIARAVVALASSLGLEGVETSEQCELFRTLSCDYVHGYLFQPPPTSGGPGSPARRRGANHRRIFAGRYR